MFYKDKIGKKMRNLIVLFTAVFVLGCNETSVEKTKDLNLNNPKISVLKTKQVDSKDEIVLKLNNKSKLELERLKEGRVTKLATIDATKEQKLKELEIKSKKELANIELKKSIVDSNKTISVESIKSETELKIKEKESSFYKVAVIILALILIIWLIFKYLSLVAKRKHEEKLREKELQQEAYLEELKLKHQNISKMLDIIGDKNSDKDVKKAIAKLLDKGRGNILENK